MSKITHTVLVAEDHPLYRKAVVSILKKVPFIDKIVEADNGLECLKHMKSMSIDLVLLDIQMPMMNGIETLKHIVRDFSNTKVIVLTQFDDQRYLNTMKSLGVKGYLLKTSTEREIIHAIERIMILGEVLIQEPEDFSQRDEDPKDLGKREKEVLTLICQGLSSQQIADTLFISINTVNNHRKSIKNKLNANTLADLLNWAKENELY